MTDNSIEVHRHDNHVAEIEFNRGAPRADTGRDANAPCSLRHSEPVAVFGLSQPDHLRAGRLQVPAALELDPEAGSGEQRIARTPMTG